MLSNSIKRFNKTANTRVIARAIAPANVLSRQESQRIIAELLG